MDLTLRKKVTSAPGADFVAAPPRVNLLPPAARDRSVRRRTRSLSIGVAALTILAMGGAYASGVVAQGGQRDQLAELQTQQDGLTQQLSVYAPVTNVAAQTRALTDTVAGQTQNRVLHGDVLERFVTAVGSVGTIQTIALTTGTASAGCATTDPFNTVPLAGCLTFTVLSPTGQAGASALINQLTSDRWFVDPFIPSVTSSPDGNASLTGSVGISTEVYSAATTQTDGSKG